MEGTETESSGPRYTLQPTHINNEDLLFCVDVDSESLVEMKGTGPNGRPLTRLDSIKQAILLFIHAKLSMNPEHRFAFSILAKTASWITLDVIYLHDKPGPDNCPQEVYDSLVDTLEHVSEYEGYIHESGQGLTRVLFRHLCMLLSHPQQRCRQEHIDIPKSLKKKAPAVDSVPGEDNVTISSQ